MPNIACGEKGKKNGEADRASRLETSSAQHLDDAAVLEAAEKRLQEKPSAPTGHSRRVVNFAVAKRSIMSRRRPRS